MSGRGGDVVFSSSVWVSCNLRDAASVNWGGRNRITYTAGKIRQKHVQNVAKSIEANVELMTAVAMKTN